MRLKLWPLCVGICVLVSPVLAAAQKLPVPRPCPATFVAAKALVSGRNVKHDMSTDTKKWVVYDGAGLKAVGLPVETLPLIETGKKRTLGFWFAMSTPIREHVPWVCKKGTKVNPCVWANPNAPDGGLMEMAVVESFFAEIRCTYRFDKKG